MLAPTRPAPTIRMNMARRLANQRACAARAVRCGGGRRHNHAAAGLAHDVLRRLADEVLERRPAAEPAAAADPRGLLGAEHDRLDAAPAGLLDDRLPRPPR